MRIGFIGLGAVGGKLAGSILRCHGQLVVHDIDRTAARALLEDGAAWAPTPQDVATRCDVVITSLPSPAVSADVVEGGHGLIGAMGPTKTWIEMSTTDAEEMARLASCIEATGAAVAECPVSGGCHRAATGNISIFAGCGRPTFEAVLPVLAMMGRRILHTGKIGTASTLKVMTNYLATANLISVCEALTVMGAAGLDLRTVWQAIAISSGTSFVHETEGQVILSGGRSVDFTLGLVKKDVGLFQALAEAHDVPLRLSPLVCDVIDEAIDRMGHDAQSDRLIEVLEAATGLSIRAEGFPETLVDDEPGTRGYEVWAASGRIAT